MVISQKDNKFYAKFIDDFRLSFFPWCDNKMFREHVKSLNPNYPIDNTTGKYVSFAKISVVEFRKHLAFLKVIACKYNMQSDYTNDMDRDIARTTWFKTKIVKVVEGGSDFNIVFVLCSRCGSSTKRALTRSRFQELMDIEEGERIENMVLDSETFVCVDCIRFTGEDRKEQ